MIAVIYISGFVQNVGFRQFVKKEAVKLVLTGYVKNLQDGRVEVLVQGSKEQIETLVKHSEKRPFLSEVKNVAVEWVNLDEVYKDFEIL